MVSDILHMISHLQTACKSSPTGMYKLVSCFCSLVVTTVLAIVIWDRNRVVLLFFFVLGIVPIGTTIVSGTIRI